MKKITFLFIPCLVTICLSSCGEGSDTPTLESTTWKVGQFNYSETVAERIENIDTVKFSNANDKWTVEMFEAKTSEAKYSYSFDNYNVKKDAKYKYLYNYELKKSSGVFGNIQYFGNNIYMARLPRSQGKYLFCQLSRMDYVEPEVQYVTDINKLIGKKYNIITNPDMNNDQYEMCFTLDQGNSVCYTGEFKIVEDKPVIEIYDYVSKKVQFNVELSGGVFNGGTYQTLDGATSLIGLTENNFTLLRLKFSNSKTYIKSCSYFELIS